MQAKTLVWGAVIAGMMRSVTFAEEPIPQKAVPQVLTLENALIIAIGNQPNLRVAAGAQAVMDVLMKLNAEEGMTIVLVTHEPDIAVVARRVIMMKDGVVLSDRPAREAGDQLIFQPTT